MIRDSTFTCNTRQLFDAYSNISSTYMMQYSVGQTFGAAKHASDLLPTFWHQGWDMKSFIMDYLHLEDWLADGAATALKALAPEYQLYLANHAISGNPNPRSGSHSTYHPQWNVATVSTNGQNVQNVQNVLEVGLIPYFDTTFTDVITYKSTCDFWVDMAYDVQKLIKKQRQHLEIGIVPMEEDFLKVQDPERWEL